MKHFTSKDTMKQIKGGTGVTLSPAPSKGAGPLKAIKGGLDGAVNGKTLGKLMGPDGKNHIKG